MTQPPAKNPDGTQAIRRAASMLRHIAYGSRTGMSLRDISETMGLSRSTAHRILKCLLEEGLVDRGEGGSSRYVIGSLAFELGLVATSRWRKLQEWRPVVDAVSRATGTTAYLMGRTGNESVCLYAAEASSVVRVFPVEVGQRRPLGVGAGATALLATVNDDDLDRTLVAIEPYLKPYPSLTTEVIRKNVEAARATGFGETRATVATDVYGLGAAVPRDKGPSTLAISIAAHENMRTEERVKSWKKELASAVRSVPSS